MRQLPATYVDLSRRHNGGFLARDAHSAPSRTSWAEDHVGVYALAAIGRTAPPATLAGVRRPGPGDDCRSGGPAATRSWAEPRRRCAGHGGGPARRSFRFLRRGRV
ncbi:hypothetical protein [Micromonospora palomenae]|uniref:hypothetical protein n=1 Tax=Micromonospora palomenae TaxID=1461247 RepID=UPI003F8BBB23